MLSCRRVRDEDRDQDGGRIWGKFGLQGCSLGTGIGAAEQGAWARSGDCTRTQAVSDFDSIRGNGGRLVMVEVKLRPDRDVV